MTAQREPVETDQLPLFPLRTVLFPGGVLPLRIFEPRYIDMIGNCMRNEQGFGVVLIRSGTEARLAQDQDQPDIFSLGTEARIVDFNQTDNGLLGIVANGERKFVVHETTTQNDQLLVGQVEYLPEEPVGELLAQHQPLIDILRQLADHQLVREQVDQMNLNLDFDEARSVSFRLADLLPIEPEIKQALLQLRWPKERLNELLRIVSKFQQQ